MLAADRSLVTVEEIVDELDPRPDAVVLPAWAVTRVSVAPEGARPSYALGYYDRDNNAYRAWDAIHLRFRRLPDAWASAFGAAPAAPVPPGDRLRMLVARPARFTLAGVELGAAQPAVRLRDGTEVSLF